MASIDKDGLKKVIKEALREVLVEPDIIKSIVSEAIKTSVSAILSEMVIPAKQVQQQQARQVQPEAKRPSSAPRVDNSMFGRQLQEQFGFNVDGTPNDTSVPAPISKPSSIGGQFREDDTKDILAAKFGKSAALEAFAEEVPDEPDEMLQWLRLK
jgi:hypothetical protein